MLSNLSLEALKNVISTANDSDCKLLSGYLKNRCVELNPRERYILIQFDPNYTWKDMRLDRYPLIHFDEMCCSTELPEIVYNCLSDMVYDDLYPCDQDLVIQYPERSQFIWEFVTHKKFENVRGPESDAIRAIMWNGIPENYFREHGLSLVKEIHQSVGLLNFFNQFVFRCGVMCLFRYCDTLDKLIHSGLPCIKID